MFPKLQYTTQVLIYVFDIESQERKKDLENFQSCLEVQRGYRGSRSDRGSRGKVGLVGGIGVVRVFRVGYWGEEERF